MPNMTLSIDADLLRKARRVALEKRTSVNAMVRDYLEKLTASENKTVELKIKALRNIFDKHPIKGPITWKRADLYDRKVFR